MFPTNYFNAITFENLVSLEHVQRVDKEHPRTPNPHVAQLAVIKPDAQVCQFSVIGRIQVRRHVHSDALFFSRAFGDHDVYDSLP